jgi:hypothetical protein
MAGGEFRWTVKPSDLFEREVAKYVDTIRRELDNLADAWQQVIEDYMKINAPWKDRSSNARQGLNVTVDKSKEATELVLAHTVEYGIYLELAHAGAWAIINPTLDIYGPKVWDSVIEILS